VEMIDSQTGQSIATGYLDSKGQATIGGYRVTMTGQAAAGDGFTITANTAPNADSRALERMIALADADPTKGQGGFARLLSEMTTDMGSKVKAVQTRQASLEASHESLARKLSEVSAVDLDKEAANLIELQQAYQASAQALTVARQLFDTILNAM
jgi:flagellar hook-associated protein 1